MWFSPPNRPSFRVCWDSRRPSTTVKTSTNNSPISTSLGVGMSHKSGTSTRPPSLFALIIGINEYASPTISDLKGAVPDALAVKKYLEEDLGVPESQICILCDAEATRAAVIQEFNNLVADDRIHRGDPIFIYYAGYGSNANAPKDWATDDTKIHMLVPHDLRTAVDGRGTYGIPDRTINTLLSRVAEKWGDNITVIFDCCHSESAHARLLDSNHKARYTEIPNDVPSDLDLEIWNGAQCKKSGVVITPGFFCPGLRSHILLAACGANEVAYEYRGNGIFTIALLKLLSVVGTQNVTCASLLQRLPCSTRQTPRCEGLNRNRTLFDGQAQSQRQVLFKVQKDGENYVMDAGTARGIEVGDEFTLYKEPAPSQKSSLLGIFVVREFHMPAFALQTKAGTKQDLRVYAAKRKRLASSLEALVREMHHARPDYPRILRVEKELAGLGIDLDNGMVVFDVLDECVTAFNVRRIPYSVKPDVSVLRPILYAAAHFHWYLQVRPTEDQFDIRNKVQLELNEVKQVEGKYDDDLKPVMEQTGDNLNQNGVINLVADSEDMYGIKILNNSSTSLYIALFYFDISNLSITLLYQSPSPGQSKMDSPLHPNRSMKLGYGSGDEAPFIYTINEGQDLEVGFLKLFFSTEYVDLLRIPQLSPFTSIRPLGNAEPLPPALTSTSTWNTITVTVVLRKG